MQQKNTTARRIIQTVSVPQSWGVPVVASTGSVGSDRVSGLLRTRFDPTGPWESPRSLQAAWHHVRVQAATLPLYCLLPVEGECRPDHKVAPGARSQSRRKAMECLGGRPPEAPRAVPHLPSHSAGPARTTFKVCAPSIKSSKKVPHST